MMRNNVMMLVSNVADVGGISIDSSQIDANVNSAMDKQISMMMYGALPILLIMFLLVAITFIMSVCAIIKIVKANAKDNPMANAGLALGFLIAAIATVCIGAVFTNVFLIALAFILCMIGKHIIKCSN